MCPPSLGAPFACGRPASREALLPKPALALSLSLSALALVSSAGPDARAVASTSAAVEPDAACLDRHSATYCRVAELRDLIPATRRRAARHARSLLVRVRPARVGWREPQLRRELAYWRRVTPRLARRAAVPWSERIPRWRSWLCIHRHEGPWHANTGNGYYGGLQMDRAFQRRYGRDFIRQWGSADRWPPAAQIVTAERAYRSGRGFAPWPNTARACGLL